MNALTELTLSGPRLVWTALLAPAAGAGVDRLALSYPAGCPSDLAYLTGSPARTTTTWMRRHTRSMQITAARCSSWYALGRLSHRRSARLHAHLTGCPACRVELVEPQEILTWPGRVTRRGG